ncbi:MAG: YceI family protein [Pseudomonadota bacterium]
MNRMLAATALAAGLTTSAALADAELYVIDASHSQALFSYSHLGMSTTFGMFSGWEGEISFDADDPAASSVTVSIPTLAMFTGWEERDAHFQSGDFFSSDDDSLVTFTSTGIEVTGETTANITGDLTINGVTQEVVLDTVMNMSGPHPLPQMNGALAAGFTATTQILRSDFNVGAFAPFISDEVDVTISIEAIRAEDMPS